MGLSNLTADVENLGEGVNGVGFSSAMRTLADAGDKPMIVVRDLSGAAVARMTPVDLASVTGPPAGPVEPFEFHGCECGVASFKGQPPWELHTSDELIHVLAGSTRLTVRGADGESVRQLRPGDLAIVPNGCWHRNYAPDGVTLLYMTPREGTRNSWDDP